MNPKEKLFLRKNLITILGIVAVFAVLWIGSTKVMGNHFTEYLFV